MHKLIIHLGFPKTGTTSIQKNLFSKLNNYYGKEVYTRFPNANFRTLRSTLQRKDPEWWGTKDSLRQRETLTRLGTYLFSKTNTVIISYENFLATEFFGPNHGSYERIDGSRFHPADHIAEIIKLLTPSDTQISVLITSRAQWTLLPSLYAQTSNRIKNASQENFENYLEEYLNSGVLDQSTLNYLDLGKRLNHTLSLGELNFLPIEKLGSIEYSNALANVIEVESNVVHDALSNSYSNKRQMADNHWKLRTYTGPKPDTKINKIKLKSLNQYIQRQNNVKSFITMSPYYSNQLRKVFSPSNKQMPETWTPLGLPGYFHSD